jgi:phage terminase large subunit
MKRPADFPKAYRDLFQSHRYKVYYGGRGAAKSWAFARALLIQATQDPLRVLCCREVMRTLADSVHQLLVDQITALGLEGFFVVSETGIEGANGARFMYAGLRAMDAAKIKSYEGVDVAWVEEGQTVSDKSWSILIPTIRAERSEIWVSFNPELDTDPTYVRFVANRPPDCIVKKVTFRDNPFFPSVLEKERAHLAKSDAQEYEHIWEGKPRTVVEGAIYAREVTQMIEDGRVRALPYDPRLKVHTIWDLGWNDQTSIIFAQRMLSEVRVIDYAEESFLRYDEWAKLLEKKPYLYGAHWLPHDGGHETQGGGGLSAQKQLRPLLGKNPKIIKRPDSVEVPIRAARMMFPRVYMDAVKCAPLLECLKRFRRAVPQSTGEPGLPVKDEYRHGADAFGGLAMIVDKLGNENEQPAPRLEEWEPLDRGIGM